jgi:hypothetical protein
LTTVAEARLPLGRCKAAADDGVGTLSLGTVIEATSNVAATTGNLFRYDGGQYIYNWSTKGLTQGTYSVKIDLGDGAPMEPSGPVSREGQSFRP